MQAEGIQGRVVKVTRRQPGLKRFKASGENLRLTAPEASGPDQIWVSDVTYLKLHGCWLYLAVVMDIYTRRVLGWSLDRTRTTTLTLTALKYALRDRTPKPGLIFHTDRGIEYTGFRFRDALLAQGMRPSLNRPGCCTDNGHMESFFHSLKAELIRGRQFNSEHELRYALASYINQFYNHKRLHSGIDYHPPAVYENMVA
jgi:putative transposase